jgi:hypothetical protein
VSKGDPGDEGQRRDDLAEIDLGIDRARATELWQSTLAYRTAFPSLERPDTDPVEEKQ